MNGAAAKVSGLATRFRSSQNSAWPVTDLKTIWLPLFCTPASGLNRMAFHQPEAAVQNQRFATKSVWIWLSSSAALVRASASGKPGFIGRL